MTTTTTTIIMIVTTTERSSHCPGTHGKTSTSALLAHTLQAIGLSPSAVIGGDVLSFGASKAKAKASANANANANASAVGNKKSDDDDDGTATAKNWIAGEPSARLQLLRAASA